MRMWRFRSRELREEMDFHREQVGERAFGNDLLWRERSRDMWGWLWLEQLNQDLRLSWRRLRRRPGSSLTAIAVLALAIGAGTALFSVFDAVLLRPLPYAHPDRLVVLEAQTGLQRLPGPPGSLRLAPAAWRGQLRTLTDWTTYEPGLVNLGGGGGLLPEQATAAAVSPTLFPLLGVAVLGRGFQAGDDRPGHDHVVVVREDVAQRFGGAQAAVGRSIRVNGSDYRIIGVAPRWCDVPQGTELWLPFANPWDIEHDNISGSAIMLGSMARLAPGATLASARAELIRVEHTVPNDMGDFDVVPLQRDKTASDAPALWLLLGAAGMVLVIACANAAGLQLARALELRPERAVQTALGATRGRLARQMLTESLLVAAVGGLAGCGLAGLCLVALSSRLPASLALTAPPALDTHVLLFAIVAAVASGAGAALAPITALRRDPSMAMQEAGIAAPRRSQRLRSGLVVLEVALATVLLAGAGLLLQSLARLETAPLGFRAQGLLTAKLRLDATRYPEAQDAKRGQFYRRALAAVGAVPGVQLAALGTNLPLNTGPTFDSSITAGKHSSDTMFSFISPGYFRTLGVPLEAGRDFDASDTLHGPTTVIVSHSLAARLWPGENPVGQHLVMPSLPGTHIVATVIGVAGDTRLRLNGDLPAGNIYQSLSQVPASDLALIVRVQPSIRADSAALASALRHALAAVDPDTPLAHIATMDALLRTDAADSRFRSALVALFAALALVLSMAGLGSVLLAATAARAREIGIRMALGAQPRQAAGVIFGQGVRLMLIGLGLGLGGALLLGRYLRHFLFGVGAHDPAALAATGGLLACAGIAACWWPARRAARVDPLNALKSL